MQTFCVADLDASGELRTKATYTYGALEQIPGCPELIGTLAGELWRQPEGFDHQFLAGSGSVIVRWRASAASAAAGVATIWSRKQLASISLMAAGVEPDADRITLETFQRHLVRELHDTGFEPAFALMQLAERPLVATVNFHSPEDRIDQHLVALSDRCLAAAVFRYQRLV